MTQWNIKHPQYNRDQMNVEQRTNTISTIPLKLKDTITSKYQYKL
jgi:hypothetical protein